MTATIHPPYHLLRSRESCWKCGSDAEVIAFTTAEVTGEEDDDNELPVHSPVVLTNIRSAPHPFLIAATRSGANYESRFSKTAGHEYFMNQCGCGAVLGDHFLHNEPGHAFFPMNEEEASSVQVQEIDCSDPLEIECCFAGWSSLCLVKSGTMVDGKIDVTPS